MAQRGVDDSDLTSKLKWLFASQRLAVLATQSEGQPYNCLVAVVETDDLRRLLFVTSRTTRKYHNLRSEPRVSLLVDNRSNDESDFHGATAATAIGVATEVDGAEERARLSTVYLAKHGHLRAFLDSPDAALISVEVSDYVISSFTQVWILRPG
jgi:nitroimidazol reductase NimA-like FMN-containing flavoprotein (pyridoxamine 5'-phosphate oxidase superfamily)